MEELTDIEKDLFSTLVAETIRTSVAAKRFIADRSNKLSDPEFIKMINSLKVNLEEAVKDINDICDNIYIDHQLGVK